MVDKWTMETPDHWLIIILVYKVLPDEGRECCLVTHPGDEEAQAEHADDGTAGDAPDNDGGLHHARHQLDAVGQPIPYQAVQGREDLGQKSLQRNKEG